MSDRSPKTKTISPSTSPLDMMLSGEGFGSAPLEEVPEPPAGSFGELFARVAEDRAMARKNLDDARPYLKGMKSLNDSKTEGLERKGQAIVEVWKSSNANVTLAEAVRRAEEKLGLMPGCDDPEGQRARKRGRAALAQIGLHWVRGKGPEVLVPHGSGN
jgi:hypothetical protein